MSAQFFLIVLIFVIRTRESKLHRPTNLLQTVRVICRFPHRSCKLPLVFARSPISRWVWRTSPRILHRLCVLKTYFKRISFKGTEIWFNFSRISTAYYCVLRKYFDSFCRHVFLLSPFNFDDQESEKSQHSTVIVTPFARIYEEIDIWFLS